MTTTLLRAERIQEEARSRLLDFAFELGQGKWAGKDHEAAMYLVEISREIGKATKLMFASDGTEENTPSSPDLN